MSGTIASFIFIFISSHPPSHELYFLFLLRTYCLCASINGALVKPSWDMIDAFGSAKAASLPYQIGNGTPGRLRDPGRPISRRSWMTSCRSSGLKPARGAPD